MMWYRIKLLGRIPCVVSRTLHACNCNILITEKSCKCWWGQSSYSHRRQGRHCRHLLMHAWLYCSLPSEKLSGNHKHITWWVLPYLGMVGKFLSENPVFEILNPICSLLYASNESDWPPLSAQIIGTSLSHLVSEIFGPKVGLNFHQSVLFNSF